MENNDINAHINAPKQFPAFTIPAKNGAINMMNPAENMTDIIMRTTVLSI